MIRCMRSKVVAGLLICGWVLLSGLDLLEDLHEIPSHGVISSAASADPLKWKRNDWGALANNIVESATRLPQAFGGLSGLTAAVIDVEVDLDFRRYFSLHKLYRVFLI
jgi:hypothetical protein